MLLVAPFYPPVVSGAGRYAADIAVGMAQRGHHVTVMTGGGSPGVIELDGVTVERVPGPFRGATSMVIVGRALARHRREPFDLIVSGVAYPMGVVGAIVARAVRRPLAVMALGEDVSVGQVSRRARWWLRRVFAVARCVVSISAFTRGEVVRFGALPERCVVAPPGIDPGPFVAVGASERHAFRRRFGLERHLVVLTVARLEERTGHDTVLAAVNALIAELPDLHYLVIGAGDPRRLRDMAGRLGMAHRLTILDEVGDATLPSAFAAADVFAMVSRPGGQTEVEGFGIVYLEAAAAGLPCVAGDLGGCPDAVIDGVTGLCVDPLDVQAVAAGLRAILASPTRAAQMAENGRRHVIANHQRRDLQQTVGALFEDVARDSQRT